ncbi:hypothetical protein FSARC_3914 [Fusarium sarcochroum]|uniref:Uncharacterized protein n=1 Tax=Fusarium sarcochroum TaxID=1208366 RepID=A0A8H4U3G3_9HYPO|nr:hypothetical protein FSARC_3914 [Fusarium sarcochroum]
MGKPKNVNGICRQHPRERLFVQPLEWTQLHLELLNCSFQEETPETPSKEPEDDTSEVFDGKKSANRSARTAERLATSEMKNAAIKKLVTEDGGPLRFQRPFGYFCFGIKHEYRLHGAVFSLRSSGSLSPVFAFLQRGMIKIQRESVFQLPKPRRPNPPAELLREMRLKQLEPSDHWRDPYVLAVLVGLAQSQAEEKHSPKYPFPENHIFKACAAFVDENNTDFMYFYDAQVSVAFLSKFEYPHTLMKPKNAISSELGIRMKKLPFQPYSSFQSRLLAGVQGCCGDAEAATN